VSLCLFVCLFVLFLCMHSFMHSLFVRHRSSFAVPIHHIFNLSFIFGFLSQIRIADFGLSNLMRDGMFLKTRCVDDGGYCDDDVLLMVAVVLMMMLMLLLLTMMIDDDDVFHRMPRRLCPSDPPAVAAAPTTLRPRSYPAICNPKFPFVFPQT
jgi:hypothetical protein